MEIFLLIVVITYAGYSIYNFSPLFSKSDKIEYMKSDTWKAKRLLALKRDSYKCRSCNASGPLEVHHITYKRLGNEKLKDLVSVCRSCHQNIHNKYGYDYQSFFPLIKAGKHTPKTSKCK